MPKRDLKKYMNWTNDNEIPNHKIVKALYKKGFHNFMISYSKIEFWCIDAENTYLMKQTNGWLGYTIKSSIKKINSLNQNELNKLEENI